MKNNIDFDPFPIKPWNASIRLVTFDLNNVLLSCGFNYRTGEENTETICDISVPELDWNPIIINNVGEEIAYQRDFCWSLKDKQLLIDSIYNGIEIGKIVIRKRSWEYVENRIKKGIIKHTAFKDIVDGKQRLNAIMEFLKNNYPDSKGRYFKDMNIIAQKKFMYYDSLTFGMIGEDATDSDVKDVFININFAGVPMSQEHIDFVKNINLK